MIFAKVKNAAPEAPNLRPEEVGITLVNNKVKSLVKELKGFVIEVGNKEKRRFDGGTYVGPVAILFSSDFNDIIHIDINKSNISVAYDLEKYLFSDSKSTLQGVKLVSDREGRGYSLKLSGVANIADNARHALVYNAYRSFIKYSKITPLEPKTEDIINEEDF
jgi:hypothetical protein